MGENYYSILRIPTSATQRDIKVAYRKLVHEHHPDINNSADEEYIKQINVAYETLSDPVKKTNYDSILTGGYHQEKTASYNPPSYPNASRRRPPPNFYYGAAKRENYSFSLKTQLIGWGATILVIASVIIGIYGMHYYVSIHYYEEGLAAERNNNLEGALSNYQLAIRDWGSKSVDASIRSAEITKRMGAYFYMIDFCKRGLSYEPDTIQAAKLYYLMGGAYYQNEQYEKAEESFLNSLSFNFSKDSIYNQLGWIYINHLRNYNKAEKIYSYLLASNSINYSDYYHRGICYQFLGKHQLAIDDFLVVLEYNPYNGRTLFQLGRSYLALGETQLACEYLSFAERQSINIDPADMEKACGSLNL
jgi:curved DNA-binding protein CbpA